MDGLRLDDLVKEAEQFLNYSIHEEDNKLVQELIDSKDEAQLRKLFEGRIQFGTAGLRSRMGPGWTAMNDVTVLQTTQGLAKYMVEYYSTKMDKNDIKVAVGYDGRHRSRRFAEITAYTFARYGLKVMMYSQMTPTPLLAWAVKHLKCSGGVMVTASHNPKDDNGYKLYWGNGAQIVSPIDSGVQAKIMESLIPDEKCWPMGKGDVLEGNPNITPIPQEVITEYFTTLKQTLHFHDNPYKPAAESNGTTDGEKATATAGQPLKICYTAMHGVGTPFARQATEAFNLKPLVEVPEQADPDAEFPTVTFPNPEEGTSALNLAMKRAEAEGCRVILANDPDADRLAVAELDSSGKWKVFTGNEIGILFGGYLWANSSKFGVSSPDQAIMLASAVSSKMLEAMAKKEGFKFAETLTGFKWIANGAITAREQDGLVPLFAFEEAIGFMCSDMVLDKDGISALACMAEYATQVYAQQRTLQSELETLYARYGFFTSYNSYVISHDSNKTNAAFNAIRANEEYPKIINGREVKFVRDLTTGYDNAQPDKKAILPTSTSSNMITFSFIGGLILTLRTSGTEPKIKWYSEKRLPGAAREEWAGAEESLKEEVNGMIEELLKPTEYGFQRRAE
eukprot:Clim_evm81s201 gene=Clim_evmTU81s201